MLKNVNNWYLQVNLAHQLVLCYASLISRQLKRNMENINF